MKQRENIFHRITEIADLPNESVPGVPLLELAADRRILIENHKAVTEYSQQRIRVQVCFGQICICGRSLELMQMKKTQLVICGRIDSISIQRGGGK